MAREVKTVKNYKIGERSKNRAAAISWAAGFDLHQGFFYIHDPTDRIVHTTASVTPVMEHWLERESLVG